MDLNAALQMTICQEPHCTYPTYNIYKHMLDHHSEKSPQELVNELHKKSMLREKEIYQLSKTQEMINDQGREKSKSPDNSKKFGEGRIGSGAPKPSRSSILSKCYKNQPKNWRSNTTSQASVSSPQFSGRRRNPSHFNTSTVSKNYKTRDPDSRSGASFSPVLNGTNHSRHSSSSRSSNWSEHDKPDMPKYKSRNSFVSPTRSAESPFSLKRKSGSRSPITSIKNVSCSNLVSSSTDQVTMSLFKIARYNEPIQNRSLVIEKVPDQNSLVINRKTVMSPKDIKGEHRDPIQGISVSFQQKKNSLQNLNLGSSIKNDANRINSPTANVGTGKQSTVSDSSCTGEKNIKEVVEGSPIDGENNLETCQYDNHLKKRKNMKNKGEQSNKNAYTFNKQKLCVENLRSTDDSLSPDINSSPASKEVGNIKKEDNTRKENQKERNVPTTDNSNKLQVKEEVNDWKQVNATNTDIECGKNIQQKKIIKRKSDNTRETKLFDQCVNQPKVEVLDVDAKVSVSSNCIKQERVECIYLDPDEDDTSVSTSTSSLPVTDDTDQLLSDFLLSESIIGPISHCRQQSVESSLDDSKCLFIQQIIIVMLFLKIKNCEILCKLRVADVLSPYQSKVKNKYNLNPPLFSSMNMKPVSICKTHYKYLERFVTVVRPKLSSDPYGFLFADHANNPLQETCVRNIVADCWKLSDCDYPIEELLLKQEK